MDRRQEVLLSNFGTFGESGGLFRDQITLKNFFFLQNKKFFREIPISGFTPEIIDFLGLLENR